LSRVTGPARWATRPVARGVGESTARPRLRFAMRLQPCRPVGVAPRLRHGGSERQRHHWRQGELFPGKEPGPQFYPVSAIDYLTGYLMALGALVALARRAREGGSWLVRCSLAQAGRWLVGRGEVPEAATREHPAGSPRPRSINGRSRPLPRPANAASVATLQLSETQPYWARRPCRSATTSRSGRHVIRHHCGSQSESDQSNLAGVCITRDCLASPALESPIARNSPKRRCRPHAGRSDQDRQGRPHPADPKSASRAGRASHQKSR